MLALAIAFELFSGPCSPFRSTLLLDAWLDIVGRPPPLEMENGFVKPTPIFVPPKTMKRARA